MKIALAVQKSLQSSPEAA